MQRIQGPVRVVTIADRPVEPKVPRIKSASTARTTKTTVIRTTRWSSGDKRDVNRTVPYSPLVLKGRVVK